MACHYDTPAEENRKTSELLDKLTRMLCATCKLVESRGFMTALDQETYTWWHKHKTRDLKIEIEKQKELEQLQLRQRARRKLTDEEREAVGL